jgi:putative FmdB family regulatory protein
VPLYEYQCANDGTFERMQKFSDPPLTECPKCGGPVEKLLSAPAIQFKGTGWYITDYARKSSGGESGQKDDKSKATAETKEPASAAKDSSSASATTSASTGSGGSDKK